jgi:DtxR family Mn-dependent transcriptional regulator
VPQPETEELLERLYLEVTPLSDGRPGAEGAVAYLATRDNREIQKLMAMGILPGLKIKLMQRFPSYVFQVGYSQFTVDHALAETIYVHWAPPPKHAESAPKKA